MRLKVLLPSRVLLDEAVAKVKAEGGNGHFCLLPRHVDFVSALVPGILTCALENGRTLFVGVDEGILIKRGPDVLASVRRGVVGEDLERILEQVKREYLDVGERDRAARSAMARLEAGFVQRFLEITNLG